MEKSGFFSFFKRIYNDPVKWQFLKSLGFFLISIKIAKECCGMELMQ